LRFPERGDSLRERLDGDRDREGERASLPLLMKTLRGVAADAAALPGPAPAKRPAPLRLRLSGAAVLTMPPPRAGPVSNAFATQAPRPRAATGPPGR